MPDNKKEAAARRTPTRRHSPSSKKSSAGRHPIGLKSMNVVLQVRLTEEVRSAVKAMGGSTWARGVIESALKRAADQGKALPRAYLKTLSPKKAD